MLQLLLKNKFTLILIAVIILLLAGGVFAFQKFSNSNDGPVAEEVDLPFDPEGPYALLYPRRDGNALVLNLKRTASYDKISYELAYVSQNEESSASASEESSVGGGIDRGVMGDINTKEKKGEYEQEILFGTCSKNVCKYDKGVENGTLTLHIQKDRKAYRMIVQWHLQKPDFTLGVITSGDGHMVYKIDPNSADLSLTKFIISNELTGVPKLPSGKTVIGKVYSVNTPQEKNLPAGNISIELADKPGPDYKIAGFNELENKWIEFDTKIDGSKLTTQASGSSIFAVLAPKQ